MSRKPSAGSVVSVCDALVSAHQHSAGTQAVKVQCNKPITWAVKLGCNKLVSCPEQPSLAGDSEPASLRPGQTSVYYSHLTFKAT